MDESGRSSLTSTPQMDSPSKFSVVFMEPYEYSDSDTDTTRRLSIVVKRKSRWFKKPPIDDKGGSKQAKPRLSTLPSRVFIDQLPRMSKPGPEGKARVILPIKTIKVGDLPWHKTGLRVEMRVVANSERRDPATYLPIPPTTTTATVYRRGQSLQPPTPDKGGSQLLQQQKRKRSSVRSFIVPPIDPSHRPTLANIINTGLKDGEQVVGKPKAVTRQIGDYRPLHYPFVPDLVRILVCSIETDCRQFGWSPIIEPISSELQARVQPKLDHIVNAWKFPAALHSMINSMALLERLACLRGFLESLTVKLLHMNKDIVKRLTSQPLYDQFLRPSTNIRQIIRQAILPQTRTATDTLSFLMLHLIKAWRNLPDIFQTRIRLTDLYGPLLVSFTDRPLIVDRDIDVSRSEESVILEAALDVCDAAFWNHLSMLKVQKAFSTSRARKTTMARDEVLNTSNVPLPIYTPYKKKVSLPGLRSTSALLRDLQHAHQKASVPSNIRRVSTDRVNRRRTGGPSRS